MFEISCGDELGVLGGDEGCWGSELVEAEEEGVVGVSDFPVWA